MASEPGSSSLLLLPPHPRQPSFLRLQPVCQACQPAPKLSPLKMSTVPLSSSQSSCTPHRCPCCRVQAAPAAFPRPGRSKCYHCTPTATPEAQESLLTLPVPHVLHPLCGQVLRVSPSGSLRLLVVLPPRSGPRRLCLTSSSHLSCLFLHLPSSSWLRPSPGFLQPQGDPHAAQPPHTISRVSPHLAFSPAPRTGLPAPTGQFLSSLPLLGQAAPCAGLLNPSWFLKSHGGGSHFLQEVFLGPFGLGVGPP